MRKKQRNTLFIALVIAFAVTLLADFILVILTFILKRPSEKIPLMAAVTVLGIILMVLDVVFFAVFVYRPMRQVRAAFGALDIAGTEDMEETLAGTETVGEMITALQDKMKGLAEREHGSAILYEQAQYAQLQNQINPHFLYNTLETIRGQAIIDDNYLIADMTEALGKYFRYSISRDNDTVTVGQELDNILNYVQIQQYRFQDRFIFRIYPHVPEEEYNICKIPKMTLQPIVENAIFHGMEQKVDKGHISIHIDVTEDKLIIIVADDGVGMDEAALEKMNRKLRETETTGEMTSKGRHNGIAIENVNRRLKLLFGSDYGLRVSSTKGLGTEVEVTLPKVLMDEKKEDI